MGSIREKSDNKVKKMAATTFQNLSRRDFGRVSMLTLAATVGGGFSKFTSGKPGAATPNIDGYVVKGFEPVLEAFTNNFVNHGDVGAAFSLYHHGERVVDLWGGVTDAESGNNWAEDNIVMVFSSTKGATAACAHLLVERGELDLNAPVSQYWPEFAAAGKEDIPVRWLLSHRVGLPIFDTVVTPEQFLDWDFIVEMLAAQTPAWEPGTTHGYHAGTYGWLVGEIIKRISGKSVGTFFAEEVADPFELDFWIGLPEGEEHRVVPMVSVDLQDEEMDEQAQTDQRRALLEAARDEDSYLARPQTTEPLDPNSRAFRAAEIPAGNGITDARSLARMYASMIGDGVDGKRLLKPETVAYAITEQSNGRDEVLQIPTRFALGFSLNAGSSLLGNEGAFGHSGAGGSLGFADPEAGIAFGYVMNKMQLVAGDDPRTLSLISAVHKSLS